MRGGAGRGAAGRGVPHVDTGKAAGEQGGNLTALPGLQHALQVAEGA